MTRLRLCLVLAALFACAESAHAQQSTPAPTTTLGIVAPPRGSLSRAQLEAIAKNIHALEANPLASDAADARRVLLTWITDSPDVTVQMCAGALQPLSESTSRYHGELLLQFVLSSSAYAIEHPDQAGDVARVTAGGLEGALATYTALKAQQGEQAADAFMDQLSGIRERGGLEEHARAATRDCE
ncbi:MAG: hypothetical protein ACJ8J0_23705 [Longimicrobiaceae bacterium]